MKENPPRLDAEKMPTDELLDKFRDPPGIGNSFSRSTLLVGTRGSGKTMLLRRMRHLHRGTAIYGDLRKILNAISSDIGASGGTFDSFNPSQEIAIINKSLVLLASWMYDQVLSRGFDISIDKLIRVFPSNFRISVPTSHPLNEWISDNLYSSDLSLYYGSSMLPAFLEYSYYITDTVLEKSSDFVLLLDRAEDSPYPCFNIYSSLLDQGHPFLAVIATRPGIFSTFSALFESLPLPGDHYDVIHLGCSPYSFEWRNFQDNLLNSWLPYSSVNIPPDFLRYLLNISRDSIRFALKLVHNSVDSDGKFNLISAQENILMLKDMSLQAAQGKFRYFNNDLAAFLRKIRRSTKTFSLPVLIRRKQGNGQLTLLLSPRRHNDLSREEKAVCIGLRTGLFTTISGEAWHPFKNFESLEIHPLYIWDMGDIWLNT